MVIAYNPATAINTGTTTINGGKITTGSITASQIAANTITGDKIQASTLLSAPRIVGGDISGVTISGAIIRSSYIDYSADNALTNWKSVTNINNIPTQYWGNFALGENGFPITDSEGYYRLVTTDPLVMAGIDSTSIPKYSSYSPNVYSYDYVSVFARKPVTQPFKLLPLTKLEEWVNILKIGVDNRNVGREYWGGSLRAGFNILGHFFEVEGATEKYHYGDLSYNTVFIKLYKDGVLNSFANGSGPASTSHNSNGIPPGYWLGGHYIQKEFNIEGLQVRIRLGAFNHNDLVRPNSGPGRCEINGVVTQRFTDTVEIISYDSDGANYSYSSATWNSFAGGLSDIVKLGYLTPGIGCIVDIKVPYPIGTTVGVKSGYSGPLFTVEHKNQGQTWTWENLPSIVKLQFPSLEFGRHY